MIFGTGLCCSFTASQVHKTQLSRADAAICEISALHHDDNNEMGAGTLHVHLLWKIHIFS